MGDVVSTHLDEGRRQHIAEKTGKVLGEFCRCYKEQYGVALFNSVRYEIEGNGGPQPQLLHRKLPLEDHVIYSGNIFQYIEENKKWRNRFCVVPHNYGLVLYENKLAYERELPPRVLVNSAGYKILTSVEQYLELVNNSLPGVTPKSGHSPILKCPTDFPLILWHPYARHYYFCVMTGKEQEKWRAVFQDCVRHCNNDAVYRMVYEQTNAQYDAAMARCEQERPQLESTIRTDMDQIITSKEHLASKIRAFVLPKAEVCVRNHVQPYISSILEALMTPTSQGFAEVREVFFKEVTDMNMNVVNEGGLEKLVEYMEKLSHLAFHPVKMQSCYEKMDQLKLEGLQQRFDVSSTSVFKQRAQIHMRQQMDDAVYTFETLLHQELGKLQGKDALCKSIQRILERVLKKFDYDSSTVRKKFFREALLQITIPFLLKKLAPTCKGELAKFQELIFEDFASFILVENTYEEVVLQSVMKDIMQAVKEAAVQRKHNLYRDSMVMHNSDPNLHLLGEGIPIDWGEEYPGHSEPEPAADRRRRAKQVVSVIQDDEGALPYEMGSEALLQPGSPEPPERQEPGPGVPPSSPGGVQEIREALAQESIGRGVEAEEQLTNGTDARRESGASEEVVAGSVPGDVTRRGPVGEGDGVHRATPASPAPGAEVPPRAGTRRAAPAPPVPGAEGPPGAGGQRGTPASPVPATEVPSGTGRQRPVPASPVPGAEVPSGAGEQRPAPASPVLASPVPGADVPLGAEVPHATPRSSLLASPVAGADVPSGAEMPHATPRSSVLASPVPRADVPSEAEMPHATPRSSVLASPVPGADVPSQSSVQHATSASPQSRADVPPEAEVPHGTSASPAPGAESPFPAAGPAQCHQPSDRETGEDTTPPGGECSSPQPTGTTESGEGVQTEF
ncbi:Niban-like protein 1 [Willisornis vidua]|uniref:Niban-like protein 1 n=1 Tax=Willisornis vidua TaxID=1566151 RepID=A0ABQ9D2B4_9PASS|nr:Niban-like protein 1 [Willisornis vidua]